MSKAVLNCLTVLFILPAAAVGTQAIVSGSPSNLLTLLYFCTPLLILGPLCVFKVSSVLSQDATDQNIASFFGFVNRYRRFGDFSAFIASHKKYLQHGQKTGDYVSGVCNYYSVMADLITMASGPFWHFVPMLPGKSRKECHQQFHHTVTKFLGAKDTDKVLEIGCGFGEMGRQVAIISGAKVTGLTMADEEIKGANQRIQQAGLEEQCNMVQGNYHKLPFEAETFDGVFGIYTLKYSADLDLAMSEAARVLKSGGRFLSYEVIVTDKYDPSNKQQKSYVESISDSTCMPPLWSAQAFRDAAKKAGLVPDQEQDLCQPEGVGKWYSCFERTGIYSLLSLSFVSTLLRAGETLRILPKEFTEFYETFIVHPTTDFVNAGRLGIVDGARIMTWKKP
jgi:sterol 24-C-methyltransferase